jgi:flagellin-specific chaperone FliS
MDLQTRKIHFIREVLRIKNEDIIKKLETMLHQERKKSIDIDLNSMTAEEFNALIDSAENDSENDNIHNAGEILNDLDTWK